jgi:hypothetical protein
MNSAETIQGLTPFADCPALDGYHCWSNSITKIYHHYGLPLSEEMLFGLGAGLGFMYWEQKGSPPFIGGRGNIKQFVQDIGERTGVGVVEKSTGSKRKVQKTLLQQMEKEEPQMVRVDMGFLPYFDFGDEDYHFGSHTVVICGYDGQDHVLVSDMDQSASGVKEGFYAPMTLEQIGRARGSTYKPFPPKNTYFEFDFDGHRIPTQDDILSTIRQNSEAMINPPIRNFGVKGIRRAAEEIVRWPDRFDDAELRANLFMFYIMVEIGGTGGGIFRPMYGRFLKEAAAMTGNDLLAQAAIPIHESGVRFTEAANLFKDVLEGGELGDSINQAAEMLAKNAGLEEEAFTVLLTAV